MTPARTWRVGARFYKRVSGPEEAERLIDRAHRLARAGGRTPEPEYLPDRNALVFPAIDGATGVALIDETALLPLLAPLRAIGRTDGPDLPAHDPFAKIVPRLGAEAPRWLSDRIARLRGMASGQAVVVHGDFHCGQLIRDEAGRVWVIDLEDMARGPVEADLGNFAAHLATRPETRRGDLATGVRVWSDRVRDAWDRLGEACEPALFRRHVDIALTRRALKLRDDRGEPEMLAALESLPLLS